MNDKQVNERSPCREPPLVSMSQPHCCICKSSQLRKTRASTGPPSYHKHTHTHTATVMHGVQWWSRAAGHIRPQQRTDAVLLQAHRTVLSEQFAQVPRVDLRPLPHSNATTHIEAAADVKLT